MTEIPGEDEDEEVLLFRRAVRADVDTLKGLAGAIWHEYYPPIISVAQIDYMLATMYGVEVIRAELDRGVVWELAFLTDSDAGDGDTPVGFLSFGDDGSGGIKLYKLYLLPKRHGQGIGRQMIERVKDAAARAGARSLHLQVNKRNTRAIGAYERAGFRITSSVVMDIGGGFVMDDYLMVLTGW